MATYDFSILPRDEVLALARVFYEELKSKTKAWNDGGVSVTKHSLDEIRGRWNAIVAELKRRGIDMDGNALDASCADELFSPVAFGRIGV